VGAFYSAGYPLEKLWQIVNTLDSKLKMKDFINVTVLKIVLTSKLASSTSIEKLINETIGDITFQDLTIPFSCSAMDIKTGEKVVFRSGRVSNAVRASINLPGVFKPVKYRHRYLVDGGVVDYMPIDSVKKMCGDWVLASVAKGDFSAKSLQSVLSYYLQVIDIRGSLLVDNELKKANFVLHPNVGDLGTADLHKGDIAGQIGLVEAYKKLNSMKESYILFSIDNVLHKYIKN